MSNLEQAVTAGPAPPIDLEEKESEESSQEEEEEVKLIPKQKEKGKAKLEKNREGDTIIRNIILENTVLLIQTTKVALLPKFKGVLLKLKEFITKLQIYLIYNKSSFLEQKDYVLFIISYLEDSAFDFIEVYLDNYYIYIIDP